MTSTFSVRRAQAGDAALMRAMRIASLTEAPYAFGVKLSDVLSRSETSFEDDVRRHGSSEVSTSFFLFSGVEPVGTVGAFFEPSEPQRAFICALWVDPKVRGTGAAAGLAVTATAWLADRGAGSVFAWVADNNARALAFYRKLGFVATNEIQPLPANPSQLETLWCLRTKSGPLASRGCLERTTI